MSKKFKIDLPSIIVIVIVNLLVAGVLFVSADWEAPLKAPPVCDFGKPGCDAPINVGPSTQVKSGALGVIGVLQTNSIDFNGQKVCRAIQLAPGNNWGDSLLVPTTWLNVDCLRFVRDLIASDYAIGCIFRDGVYSEGERGFTGAAIIRSPKAAKVPLRNCGWLP